MKLKKVLIIEDDVALRNEVIDEFKGDDIEVQVCEPQDLDRYLTIPYEFQMVILDWLLGGGTSDLAQGCLRKIRKACFVPVLVWTDELTRYDGEVDDVKKIFPEACLKAKSKADVKIEDLSEFLEQWYETTPAKLSNQFRLSLANAAEETLYTLAEHSEDDLARGLKTLIALEGDNEIDMEHTVDVLLRLVGRSVYGDENFSNVVQEIVKKLERAPEKRKNIESRIKELHMYYVPKDKLVRTGDIINVTFDEDQNNQLTGIVITPACDLALPKKTAFLRLALIRETDEPGDDKWILDKERKLKVCFHEILVLKNANLAASSTPQERVSVMLYAHNYQTLNSTSVTLQRTHRLDEPYRSDLLHSFGSHAGRIGVPVFTASV